MGCFSGVEQTWASQLDVGRTHIATKGTVQSGLVLNLNAGASSSYSGSGNTWRDLSGNGNNGTLVNSPTYSSLYGGSLVFNGSSQYATPTGLTDTLWQGNWTVSFWVRFDTVNTGGYATDTTLLNHGSLSVRSGLSFATRNGKLFHGLFNDDMSGNTTLTIGTWYNCVFTLNNTTYDRQIYLNGILDASGTAGGAYVGTGNNTRIAGQFLFGLNFSGLMSICSVYNRVLSAAEVAQNYNTLRGRYVDPLVTSGLVLNLDAGNTASYPGTGTAWIDLSGVTSNSTLTNGPTYNSANGGSIVFDGSNDLVSVPTTSIHNFSASRITIELWMKTNGTPTQYQLIVNTDTSGDGATWSLGFAGSNFALVQDSYQSSGAESYSPRIATSSFPVNTWTHVVATSSGGGSVGKMYINGVSQTDGTATTYQLTYASGRPIGIGLEPTTGRFPFKGSIGVVRIYKDKAFTQAEVTQNFNALRGRYGI